MFFFLKGKVQILSRHVTSQNPEVESRCILTSGCVAKDQALIMVAETLGKCGEFMRVYITSWQVGKE